MRSYERHQRKSRVHKSHMSMLLRQPCATSATLSCPEGCVLFARTPLLIFRQHMLKTVLLLSSQQAAPRTEGVFRAAAQSPHDGQIQRSPDQEECGNLQRYSSALSQSNHQNVKSLIHEHTSRRAFSSASCNNKTLSECLIFGFQATCST